MRRAIILAAIVSLVPAVALAESNTLYSSKIWSGYISPTSQTGRYYSSVSATWQVPNVTWGQTTYNPYGYEYHTAWIGIGGVGNSTLLQMGTESIVRQSGAVNHYVWYELYPAVSRSIPYSVSTGDTINASITCVANCAIGQQQTWKFSMHDQNKGWTWNQNFAYVNAMTSAEWIVESPTYGSILPLNNYGKITFSHVLANGGNPNLTLNSNSVIMTNPAGQTSNPSDPVNGSSFSTCYGYHSYTPCN